MATNPPPPQTCLALTYARTHVCPRTSHLMHTCVRTCTSPPDCGMSCHKQCKELVDVECKRRPSLGAMAAPLLPLSSGKHTRVREYTLPSQPVQGPKSLHTPAPPMPLTAPPPAGSDEDLSPMARDVATQTEPPHYELWARLQTLEQVSGAGRGYYPRGGAK